jgi:dipeptidyl aminopeptidase/acylaminoacyl peptidase
MTKRSPKKFRAAVDVVGITDFVAYMSYKPEYRRQDVAKTPRFDGMPFENLPAYMDASPLTHVDKIETPLLIHATTFDRTAPIPLHLGWQGAPDHGQPRSGRPVRARPVAERRERGHR